MESLKTAKEVVKFCEDRDVEIIHLWFVDILGQLKAVAITLPRAGHRARGRRGRGRLVGRGLRAHLRERPGRDAGHQHLPDAPLEGERRKRRPAHLRHPQPGRLPVHRGHPLRHEAPREEARPRRAAPPTSDRSWSTSTSRGSRTARFSTRPATSTRCRTTSAPSSAPARSRRSRPWRSRWRRRTTRSRTASTRSTSATPKRSKWPTRRSPTATS